MLSHLFVLRKSKNFTSDSLIRMPPDIPFEITMNFFKKEVQAKNIIPCYYIHNHVCLEHSNFLKVKYTLSIIWQLIVRRPRAQIPVHRLVRNYIEALCRYTTTSFLTATNLIYAIGAGITAAAGTRLALQWLLTKILTLGSFQLQNIKNIPHCYFLSLPPYIRIG